jgi:hypothetical protein
MHEINEEQPTLPLSVILRELREAAPLEPDEAHHKADGLLVVTIETLARELLCAGLLSGADLTLVEEILDAWGDVPKWYA